MARPLTATVRLLAGEREPARVATTANITLSGLKTIDGVALIAGDRVIAKNQTNGTTNGVYAASVGIWYRASDSRSARAINKGVTIRVQGGTVNGNRTFQFNTLDPVIGVSVIEIVEVLTSTEMGFTSLTSATSSALAAALAGTNGVLAPGWMSAITLAAGDVLNVIREVHRLRADATVFTLNIPAGIFSGGGDWLIKIGPNQHNMVLNGAPAIEAFLTSITSVTNIGSVSEPIWQTVGTFNTNMQTAGLTVGSGLMFYNAWPSLLHAGDESFWRMLPVANEIMTPTGPLNYAYQITAGDNKVYWGPPGTVPDLVEPTLAYAGNPADCIEVGMHFHVAGMTRRVTGVFAPVHNVSLGYITVSANWDITVPATRGYWITRPNAGTIGTAGSSATITGASTLFTTEANVGDSVICEDGSAFKITAIGGATGMTANFPQTIAAGTQYTIVTPAGLHEGIHEVTAVSGSTVTWLNTSKIKPPINKVVGAEVRGLVTVIKQTGSGRGLLADFAQLRGLNNVWIQGGPSSLHGLALNSFLPSIDQGHDYGSFSQQGTTSNIVVGPNFATSGFEVNWLIGMNCSLTARAAASSSARVLNIWNMENGFHNGRRVANTGSRRLGYQGNGHSMGILTEMHFWGNADDQVRAVDNASVYGEIVHRGEGGAMGGRWLNNGRMHFNESACIGHAVAGDILENGQMDSDRSVYICNGRNGIELQGLQSGFNGRGAWIAGTSGLTGDGKGLQNENGRADLSYAGIHGNKTTGAYSTGLGAVTVLKGARLKKNGSNDVEVALNAVAEVNGAYFGTLAQGTGGRIMGRSAVLGSPTFSSDGSEFTFIKTAQGTVDYGSINAGTQTYADIGVIGATLKMGTLTPTADPPMPAGIELTAVIGPAGNVRVFASNNTAGAIDPPSSIITVTVVGV